MHGYNSNTSTALGVKYHLDILSNLAPLSRGDALNFQRVYACQKSEGNHRSQKGQSDMTCLLETKRIVWIVDSGYEYEGLGTASSKFTVYRKLPPIKTKGELGIGWDFEGNLMYILNNTMLG